MIVYSVLEMQNGEVTDLRSYGRNDLATQDLATRCNPEHDILFAGSCMIEHDVKVQQIAGQRKSRKKSSAAKKRMKKLKKEGKPHGRPITTGEGLRDPVHRAQVKEKLYSEGKLARPQQREPNEFELE